MELLRFMTLFNFRSLGELQFGCDANKFPRRSRELKSGMTAGCDSSTFSNMANMRIRSPKGVPAQGILCRRGGQCFCSCPGQLEIHDKPFSTYNRFLDCKAETVALHRWQDLDYVLT